MTRPVHVLMIEDNPGDALLAREFFDESSLDVRLSVATDGVEGLRYLRQEGKYASTRRPHIVLLDLNLPRLHGRDVLHAMKTDGSLCKIPVLVLTSSNAESDIESSYRLGANSYIQKPSGIVGLQRLIRLIEEYWFEAVELPAT